MLRVNSLNRALVNLVSWATTVLARRPPHERIAISRMIRVRSHAGRAGWHGAPGADLAAKVVDVHLRQVEARRRHGEPQQPIDPDHAPARGEGRGCNRPGGVHMVGLGVLANFARPDVDVDVARLTRPVGEPGQEPPLRDGRAYLAASVRVSALVVAAAAAAAPPATLPGDDETSAAAAAAAGAVPESASSCRKQWSTPCLPSFRCLCPPCTGRLLENHRQPTRLR